MTSSLLWNLVALHVVIVILTVDYKLMQMYWPEVGWEIVMRPLCLFVTAVTTAGNSFMIFHRNMMASSAIGLAALLCSGKPDTLVCMEQMRDMLLNRTLEL